MKHLLLKYPSLRNPYQRKQAHFQYWKEFEGTNGIFITKKQYTELTSAETLSRCVRSVQEENPALQSDNEIKKYEEAEQFRLHFKKEE